MKKIIYILLFLVAGKVNSYSQEQEVHEVNFILVINDDIAIGSIAKPRIITRNWGEIEIVYHPGKLVLQKDEYERLSSVQNDSLVFAFDYYEYQGENQTLFNYRFPFSMEWLNWSFTVMRVYNLDNEKYKDVFEPLDTERNYTFELDYPGGQMLRVKNEIKEKP